MKREIVTTEDGSKTIRLPEINESYHSVHGAVQESKHVYIKYGFEKTTFNRCNILEIGFGTGLNAILTFIKNKETGKEIFYHTLESSPVSEEELKLLNYEKLIEINPYSGTFNRLHQSEWSQKIKIEDNFIFLKDRIKIQNFKPVKEKYNLIYFDAFGPRVQPEMWIYEILQKMYFSLSDNGIFVTYCAKGDVRRNLLKTGFEVEKIPGPPGKREMLRAIKKEK